MSKFKIDDKVKLNLVSYVDWAHRTNNIKWKFIDWLNENSDKIFTISELLPYDGFVLYKVKEFKDQLFSEDDLIKVEEQYEY